MEKRRSDMTTFVSAILSDLCSGDAFYHPSGEDIMKWFNCSHEVAKSVIDSVLIDSEDRQLWSETTPARGRNKQIVKFLHFECQQLIKGDILRATSNLEIATRFQLHYPGFEDETKLFHHVQILGRTVSQLAYIHLAKCEKLFCDQALQSTRIPRRGPGISARTKIIIAFAEKSFNDYLHERTDRLPKYEEIGKVVKPNITRSRVQQILSRHLPPEAVMFWVLDKGGCWRRIARLLEFASYQADRHFRDNSHHVFSIGQMARQFDLDYGTAARAIQVHLSKEQAVLWGAESESKPVSMRVRYQIRYLTKVARKHQNNPSWRLPFQGEIGRKLGIGQTGVSRITRQWLPAELAALWTVR